MGEALGLCLVCGATLHGVDDAAEHLTELHRPKLPALAVCGLPSTPVVAEPIGRQGQHDDHTPLPQWQPWANRDQYEEERLQGATEHLRDRVGPRAVRVVP